MGPPTKFYQKIYQHIQKYKKLKTIQKYTKTYTKISNKKKAFLKNQYCSFFECFLSWGPWGPEGAKGIPGGAVGIPRAAPPETQGGPLGFINGRAHGAQG